MRACVTRSRNRKERADIMGSSILAFALTLAVFASAEDSLQGHKLLRVIPKSQEHLDYLDNLLKDGQEDLDFWSYPVAVGKEVDIHAQAGVIVELIGDLEGRGMQCVIVIENLQEEVEKEKPSARARAGGFDTRYHRVGPIHKELQALISQHSDVASAINLGKSYENRDQLAIKINKKTSKKKPLFFFNCGIHAREWISPATCMYIIRQMLTTRGSDSDVQYMLNNFEWVILPVLNVDGYEYTHTNNRMWRKTRKPYSGRYGADPNRNFNYHFAGVGTSQSPGSDIYTGPRPFSEKVTYNVAKYLYQRRRELKGYIDFHAYSQMWMSPWGYTSSYPPNYDKMRTAMVAAVNALKNVHGTRYTYGPAAITIYPTTGDTTDWTFGVLGVTHSYCVELRPRTSGQGGFILPPDKIVPVGQETFAGLKALTRHVN